MKKITTLFATAALAALALVSCNKNETDAPRQTGRTTVRIAAKAPEADVVKTYIAGEYQDAGETKYQVKWSNSGEELGVIFGALAADSKPVTLTAEATTDNAPIFEGKADVADGASSLFVSYPASAYAKSYTDAVGFTLNEKQQPTLGSFDPACDIMTWSGDVNVVNGSLVLEGITLNRPMAILRINLNADDSAVAKGLVVTGLKMQVAAGATTADAVILTGRAAITAAGTINKWNTPNSSIVEAEIAETELITVGESDGINAVYLVVNPATIPAGREITFTVDGKDASGAEKQFVRTVTAPAGGMTLQAGNVNVIGLKLRDKDLVQETGEVYTKVTSTGDLADGQYLIVFEEGALAFNGGLATLDAASNTIPVAISEGTIPVTSATQAAEFTISVTEGTILSASGKYIGVSSNNNGLKQSEDASAYSNSISIDADGNAVIDAAFEGSTMALRYNSTSGQDRFRYYKNAGQQPIALYIAAGSASQEPKIHFPETEKTVEAAATSVEFAYNANKYVTETPQVTVQDESGMISGTPVVGEGKITVALNPNQTESQKTAILTVNGQGIAAGGVQLTITQEAYVPGPSLVGDGTLENPYTAGDIWTLYATEGSGDELKYVTGTVTAITEVSTQHGNATYTISDGEKSILVYRGKYLDNTAFTSEDQIAVGNIAVVYGKISIYSNAPQLASGNYLISLTTDPNTPSLSVNPESLSWGASETDAKTITVNINGNASGYTVTPATDANWNISDNGLGTVTVSPKAANSSTSADKSLSLVITHKDDNTITKTVTCTQAKNAALTIADLLAGGAKTYAGTTGEILVYAVTGSNAIVGDATGKILLYKSGHGLAVGDSFTITDAVVAAYQDVVPEITGGTFTKKSSGNAINHGTPVNLDDAAAASAQQTAFSAAGFHSAVYVQMIGAQSGRNISNGNAVLYLNQTNTTHDGKQVIVTGYIYAYNSNYKNFNFHLVSIEEYSDPDTPSISADVTALTWAADEYGASAAKTITVTTNANASGISWSWGVGRYGIFNVTINSDNTVSVYPIAANTSTTEALQSALRIEHKDDPTLYVEIPLTQAAAGGAGTPQTVEINVTEYASANNWDSTGATSYNIESGEVTLTASHEGESQNGVYFGADWRFYQARKGGVTLSVPQNKHLVEVTFTYNIKNSGVLMTPENTRLNSGTKYSLSGQSAFFTIGNTGTSTNGQVRITKIVVVYQ